jgi:hypothetical protein
MTHRILNINEIPAKFKPHPEATSGHHESYPYLYEPIHVAPGHTVYKCAGIADLDSLSIVQARNHPYAVLILSTYVGDKYTRDT